MLIIINVQKGLYHIFADNTLIAQNRYRQGNAAKRYIVYNIFYVKQLIEKRKREVC